MKMENVEYTVIKEHGIIKATINGCSRDALIEFNKRFMEHSTSRLQLNWRQDYDDRFIMPHSFTVVVKLHPDDMWDEEKGKAIALRRLAEKYNSSLDKHLHNIYKALTKSMGKMETYLSDHHLIE